MVKLLVLSTFILYTTTYSCQQALRAITRYDDAAFLNALNTFSDQRSKNIFNQLRERSNLLLKETSKKKSALEHQLKNQKQEHRYTEACGISVFGSTLTGLFGWSSYKSFSALLNAMKSPNFYYSRYGITALGICCATACVTTFYFTITRVPRLWNYKEYLNNQSKDSHKKLINIKKINELLHEQENLNIWLNRQPIAYPISLEKLTEYNNLSNNASGIASTDKQPFDTSKTPLDSPFVTSCPSQFDPETGNTK